MRLLGNQVETSEQIQNNFKKKKKKKNLIQGPFVSIRHSNQQSEKALKRG